MQSIVPSDRRGVEGARQGSNCKYEKMFDSVPTKCVCFIVPSDSSGIVGVRQGSDLRYALYCTK